MAIDSKAHKQLAERVERARRDRDMATGSLATTMSRLKSEFNVDTIEEAEQHLKKLRKDATKAETKYNKAVVAFKEAWNGCFPNHDMACRSQRANR